MIKNKTYRLSLMDMYFSVICLFPISTLLINGGSINKILFVVLMVLQLAIYFQYPMKGKTFLTLLLFVIHYIFAFAVTDPPYANMNLLFYFPYFLMYTYFVCDNVERVIGWLKEHEKFVMGVIICWTVLAGVSIFIPACYYSSAGGVYFGSFCGTAFRLGPSAMFIQILGIVAQVFYRRKYALCFTFVPLYCMCMGSSRAYAVLGLGIALVAWYTFCKSKKSFYISLLPVIGVLTIFVATSSIMDKILYTLDENNYGDFWFRITNSRSEFWVELLQDWNNTRFIKRFFGNGFDFSNDSIGIWAHNDFLEILCSFGILGLVHYCYAMTRLIHVGSRGAQLPFILRACVFMIWFFNAFFNMHYTYFCAMLSYPLLLIALAYCEKKD